MIAGKDQSFYVLTGGDFHPYWASIYKLTAPPDPNGTWNAALIYSFSKEEWPVASQMAIDAHGALYGISDQTVFRLTPPSDVGGIWARTDIYDFSKSGFRDVQPTLFRYVQPTVGVIVGADSAVYGTTRLLRSTVYSLTPPKSGNGPWTMSVLHNFDNIPQGSVAAPVSGLTMGSKGRLYGSTFYGGLAACQTDPTDRREEPTCGTIFELVPPTAPNELWKETTIYEFPGGAGGSHPSSILTTDGHGALYGVTLGGGLYTDQCTRFGCGMVFRLSPTASIGAPWTASILHRFSGGLDGRTVAGSATPAVVLDNAGVVYGTTQRGGHDDGGVIYELTPIAGHDGTWHETLLYKFAGESEFVPTYGTVNSSQGPLLYKHGALFGIANVSSTTSAGALLYELTPKP